MVTVEADIAIPSAQCQCVTCLHARCCCVHVPLTLVECKLVLSARLAEAGCALAVKFYNGHMPLHGSQIGSTISSPLMAYATYSQEDLQCGPYTPCAFPTPVSCTQTCHRRCMRASAAIVLCFSVQNAAAAQHADLLHNRQVLGICGQQCCKHFIKLTDLCRRKRKCRRQWRQPCRFKALQWQQ